MSEATPIETNAGSAVLYMTLELSDRTWKMLFATTAGGRRERSVPARDLGKLFAEIAAAKRRFGQPPPARVISCYEAGRDGFWLDRALRANGIENLVVDSSSIEVPRRARRRKTDRIDLVKLMALLLRWADGERKAWSVVRVPSPEAEDVRQLSRAIERLKAERGRHRTRIQALLATQGIRLVCIGGAQWPKRVAALRTWDGRPLGCWLQSDLVREGARLAQVEAQLKALKEQRDALVATSNAPVAVKARRLAALGAPRLHDAMAPFAAHLDRLRQPRHRHGAARAKAARRLLNAEPPVARIPIQTNDAGNAQVQVNVHHRSGSFLGRHAHPSGLHAPAALPEDEDVRAGISERPAAVFTRLPAGLRYRNGRHCNAFAGRRLRRLCRFFRFSELRPNDHDALI